MSASLAGARSTAAARANKQPSLANPSGSTASADEGLPSISAASSSKGGEKTGKKEIPHSGGFMSFFLMLLLHWCRRLLIVRTDIKLGIYLCTVSFLSVIFDFVNPPMTFLGRRDSILNLVFAKWGWAWTCTTLFIFSVIMNYVTTCGDKQAVRTHVTRLFYASVWWYVATGAFDTVQRATERCNKPMYLDKKTCALAGGRWSGFDISGHCFLMMLNALTIIEEVRPFANWDRIGTLIRDEQRSGARRLDTDSVRRAAYTYERHTPLLRFLFVLLTALVLIWELTLLATVVYFHNLPSKMFGSLVAAAYWFIMYRLVYQKKKVTTTGFFFRCPQPGYGIVFGAARDDNS